MRLGYAAAVLALVSAQAFAGTGSISIDATKKGPQVNPGMYGIFLEEINHGVDGGLYAEMVQNRAFEGNNPPEGGKGKFENDSTGLPHWSLVQIGSAKGSMHLDEENPLNKNTPHSLRLEVDNPFGGRVGVANGGYWGINCEKGRKYSFSVWARTSAKKEQLTVTLEDDKGNARSKPVYIHGLGPSWKQFKATITGTETDHKARLVITAGANGNVWLDMVSLMPANTWHGLPLRTDIAQMIADMQPKFVRFPGGCVVEGYSIKDAYNWKDTIGPVEQRKEMWNAWDYRRTHGMGMYEYMRFIEEMNAQPLFVLFAGDTCIFRGSEHVAKEDMGWVVDNYLDYMEYATGPASSKWGSLRAQSGHPKPFAMPMIGIGNETWTDQYWTNYPVIYKALKDKYPDVVTMACMEKEGVPIDIMDHHYYFSPRWFMNTQTYDKRDRKMAKVYCGEVASPNKETNGGYNMLAALAESTFMLNCEKNADVVRMISYAPLIANVDGKTGWHGCINFDSSRVFGTPSYYAQKLFSTNTPSYTVASDVKAEYDKPETVPGRMAVETKKLDAEFKDIKVTAGGKTPSDIGNIEKGEGIEVKDGVISITNNGTAKFGDAKWENCTVSLKIKINKINDAADNNVIVHFINSDKMDCGFSIYGGGTKSQIYGCDNAYGEKPVNFGIGEWHDLKVEVNGLKVKAYVDGQLLHDIEMRALEVFSVGSGIDEKTGEMVIKVVNSHPEAITTTLNIAGVTKIAPDAQVTVMKASSLEAENNLDNPKSVAPVTAKLNGAGNSFTYKFEPYSITVIRLKTK